MSTIPQSLSFYQPLNEPRVYVYTRENESTPFSSHHVIYDPTRLVPEPDFPSSIGPFDGWFGILSPSLLSFTHVRAPHPIEILTLYGLSTLIPLYPTTFSSLQIRSSVLHILPFPIIQYITHTFLSRIFILIIPSSLQMKCVSVNT